MPRLSMLCLCVLVATARAAPPPASGARDLRVATWNLEWLVAPATAHAGRLACDAGRRTALPCDVARRLARDSADHARLAAHARRLDADVIAVQEVEDETTLRRVFAGYRICLAAGPGLQHTGFAVRAGLPHRCEPSLAALSLEGRLRPGALLTLWPDSGQSITLLAVHLKSGCSSDPPGSARAACRQLATQMAHLAGWLDAQAAQHPQLIVLGDFNRAGPDAADPLWQGLLEHPALPLQDAAAGERFRNCYAGQPFWQPIDHILVSAALAPRLRAGSFRKHGYRSAEAVNYRLSDHCPVSIDIRPPGKSH
ncbi:MAG: endonuclease/exonuclease/phosphatase family protein [Steroidobacteraceae bacterium]